MEKPGDLIGTSAVCELLGVDRSTVKRWVDRGRLKPAGKLPGPTGAYLFRRGDVLALKAP
jgi:excisionase family DNA binding protein